MLPTPITILLCQLFYSLQMRFSLTVKFFHLLTQKLGGLSLIIIKLLADDRICLNHFILSNRDHHTKCVPLLGQLSSELTSLSPCLITVQDQTVPLPFTHFISPFVFINLLLQCNHPCRLLLKPDSVVRRVTSFTIQKQFTLLLPLQQHSFKGFYFLFGFQ